MLLAAPLPSPASVWSEATAEIVQLVAARALQGGAAAISVPSALRLLLDAAPEPPARRVPSPPGVPVEPLRRAGLSGRWTLAEVLGWRAVFWINVPVGLLLVVGIGSSCLRQGLMQRRQGGSCRSISARCRGDGRHCGCVPGRGSRRRTGWNAGCRWLGGRGHLCRPPASGSQPSCASGRVRVGQSANRHRCLIREYCDHQFRWRTRHTVSPRGARGLLRSAPDSY